MTDSFSSWRLFLTHNPVHTLQGKGGTFCEFMVKVQPDRSIMLESCRYVGQHIMVDGNGKPVDCRSPSTSGRSFNVYVKVCNYENL